VLFRSRSAVTAQGRDPQEISGDSAMRRFLCALALAAPFVLLVTPRAEAQLHASRASMGRAELAGAYVNQSNGRSCYVSAHRLGYVFVNENGDRALFEFVSPNTLTMVRPGNWDPRVVAAVGIDRFGRSVIRFDSPGTPPGFWVASW